MIKKIALCSFITLMSPALMAAEQSTDSSAGTRSPLLKKQLVSVGAGVSHNSVGGPVDDEVGYQFFLGYDLSQVDLMDGVNTHLELGYMDYGFSGSNSGGLWFTGVVDGNIQGNWGWLGRLGFDMGDDDGLMFGAGASYALNPKMSLKAEYVIRDHIDSIQLNYVYHL